MMSPFARALLAASALTSAVPTPVGSTHLDYSLLNPMLEATSGRFEVYHVTNLNTSGTGSFFDAITGGSSNVTRIVVFDVSGACSMPLVEGGQFHDNITIIRSNLYIAGQTAPTGPNGRGFTIYAGLLFKGANNIVLEHFVMSPRNNEITADVEGGFQLRHTSSGNENFIMRNMTVKNTNDASVVYAFNNNLSVTGIRNAVVLDSLIAQPGQRDAADFYGCHAFSFMNNPRTYRALTANNLFANGFMRSPWVSTASHVAWINNYFWDFGGPNNGHFASHKNGYPLHLDVRGTAGPPNYSDGWYASDNLAPASWNLQHPNYIKLDVIGNLYEGGPSSKIPEDYKFNQGVDAEYFISVDSAEQYDPTATPQGPAEWGHYVHMNDNRVETRYKQGSSDFSDDIEIGSYTTKSDPEVVIGYDAPNTQPSNHITWRDTPRYTYPFTPMPWTAVRERALKYAGSHPANREPDDARIIAEITSRDHTFPNFRDPAPKDPVTTTVAAVSVPVVGTGNTGTLTGNHALVTGYDIGNITQLEQWLHDQHMEALGIPDGAPDYDPNIAGAWIASTDEAAD